ncbi:transglutaminase family protein [Geoalkalibacter sp.]|uniref:transglutaminase family protein n=1 Tax=Geoalkalibacter sp. TaxID=3041440 RepID=UPI00272E3F75|nr:transglutaminaseTgpA domain-containing protein [Geoalkalibacter sp.]
MRLDVLVQRLSAAIALCGYLALAPHLDGPPLLLFPALLGLALAAGKRPRLLPPPWAINLAALAVFLVYVPQLGRTQLQPAAAILVLLLGLRLLANRAPRHLLQTYALALLALAASTLFDLAPRFALYLALLFFAIALSLVLLTVLRAAPELRLSRTQLRGLLGTGLLMPALALPLAALLFLILPRTQVPLWDALNQQNQALVGYTERVQPGAAAAIHGGNAVALRVESRELAPEDLYWRGTVLNQFDGQAWYRQAPPQAPAERPVADRERRLTQRVFPEPGAAQVIFALDAPLLIEGVINQVSADRVFSGRRRPNQRVSYEATSLPGARLLSGAGPDRAFYLRLPPQLPEELPRLAARIYAEAGDAEERLARLRAFFAEGGFRYATSGLPTGEQSLSRFLLDERAGHCEFFASGFAVLARLGGIPARLVGGYYGGDYNPLVGYYLVGERQAHAWVEVWRDERGWERVDPSVYAINHAAVLRPGQGGWRHNLRLAGDALEHFWAVSLLNFDLERQSRALRETRRALRDFSFEAPGREAWMTILLLLGGAGLLWHRRTRRAGAGPLLRAFLRLARRRLKLRRLPSDLGLFDLAARLDDPAARDFAHLYGEHLYGELPLDRARKRRLRALLRRMRANQRNSRR